MAQMGRAELLAIAAVARHFSATWQSGEGGPDAYLTVGGRRIVLDVAVMPRQGPSGKRVARARLREDVVAQRVLREIEGTLCTHVPDGKTLILTLGAPIKVPKKLLAALTSFLLPHLGSGAVEGKKTILGNRIRFCVLSRQSKWTAKVVGFVFSGDPEPGMLANAMYSLHQEIAAKAHRRMPVKIAGDRWLVLSNERWIADIKTYRRAFSYLSPMRNFDRILMLFDGRRVETLAGI